MYIGVKDVEPKSNYTLLLTFKNEEVRLFDMRPFLDKGQFKELYDLTMFNTVHVSFDTIEWDNELDFDPEILYSQSTPVV